MALWELGICGFVEARHLWRLVKLIAGGFMELCISGPVKLGMAASRSPTSAMASGRGRAWHLEQCGAELGSLVAPGICGFVEDSIDSFVEGAWWSSAELRSTAIMVSTAGGALTPERRQSLDYHDLYGPRDFEGHTPASTCTSAA